MEVFYYINNQEVHAPLNSKELSVQLNWDKDKETQAVSLTEFEFGLGSQVTDGLADASVLINNHKNTSSVFIGLPVRIEIIHEGTTKILFNGYLNTSTALWDCDRVVVQGTEINSVDFLNETADSVSFAYLYEYGLGNAKINKTDFIPIPYVLNSIPDNKEAFMAVISLAFMVNTIKAELEAIIELSSALPNVLEWTTVIRLLLRIIYVIGLIILLVELLDRMFDYLIQPIKYHDGMFLKTLCEKGASHFGLTFDSSILNTVDGQKIAILPRKSNLDVNEVVRPVSNAKDYILGDVTPSKADSRGYYNGTFGELLRAMKEAFNGKIIVDGTILRFEQEDYNNGAYNYILPPVDQTEYRLNSEDLKSNYTIEFLTDINDKQTLQNYDGTLTQVITSNNLNSNPNLVLMTGLESRFIPFARGNRKLELTTPEKIVKTIAPVFDPIAGTISNILDAVFSVMEIILDDLGDVLIISIIGPANYVFVSAILSAAYGNFTTLNPQQIITLFENITGYNTGINFSNLPRLNYTPIADKYGIDSRINMLLMENDMVDIPKVLMIDQNTTNPLYTYVSSNNASVINSSYLYDNYHKNRNFVPSTNYPNGNQYLIYKASGIPFCWDDYILLSNSNRMQDDLGRDGVLISCNWNVEDQTAEIEYKINETYDSNLNVEIITPNGK